MTRIPDSEHDERVSLHHAAHVSPTRERAHSWVGECVAGRRVAGALARGDSHRRLAAAARLVRAPRTPSALAPLRHRRRAAQAAAHHPTRYMAGSLRYVSAQRPLASP
eukprot:163339-Pleurochrysis_carterae.AAC.1